MLPSVVLELPSGYILRLLISLFSVVERQGNNKQYFNTYSGLVWISSGRETSDHRAAVWALKSARSDEDEVVRWDDGVTVNICTTQMFKGEPVNPVWTYLSRYVSASSVCLSSSVLMFRCRTALSDRVNCGVTRFRLAAYDWGSSVFTGLCQLL